MAIVLVPYPLFNALLTPDQRWAMRMNQRLGWVFGASLVATAVLTYVHLNISHEHDVKKMHSDHEQAVKKMRSRDFSKEQKGEEKNTTLRVLSILSVIGEAALVTSFAGFIYCHYVFHRV